MHEFIFFLYKKLKIKLVIIVFDTNYLRIPTKCSSNNDYNFIINWEIQREADKMASEPTRGEDGNLSSCDIL